MICKHCNSEIQPCPDAIQDKATGYKPCHGYVHVITKAHICTGSGLFTGPYAEPKDEATPTPVLVLEKLSRRERLLLIYYLANCPLTDHQTKEAYKYAFPGDLATMLVADEDYRLYTDQLIEKNTEGLGWYITDAGIDFLKKAGLI